MRWFSKARADVAPVVSVAVEGGVVLVGDRRLRLEHPVERAIVTGDRLIVLFDPGSGPGDQAFANVKAYDLQGRPLWTAELPTGGSGDCYMNLSGGRRLTAWSWSCYQCHLDPETGRITERQFTK